MWGKKTYVHFNNIDNSEHGHAQACGECVSNLKTSDELNNWVCELLEVRSLMTLYLKISVESWALCQGLSA